MLQENITEDLAISMYKKTVAHRFRLPQINKVSPKHQEAHECDFKQPSFDHELMQDGQR